MAKIISNLKDFLVLFELNLNNEEKEALNYYFSNGGLVKIKSLNNKTLSYPNKDKIKKELANLKKELKEINKKIEIWKTTKKDAENYLKKLKLIKFTRTIYWKHLMKSILDKDYKHDFEKLNINIDYVADKKVEKVIKEFVENNEYREKLVETLDNSIVYKNKNIGQQMLESIEIKKSIAKSKIQSFLINKKNIEKMILAYNILSRWVVE